MRSCRHGPRRTLRHLTMLTLAPLSLLACAQPTAPLPAPSTSQMAYQAPATVPAGAASESVERKLVKIAVPGRGVSYLPLVVARAQGILEKYGIDADIQPLVANVANAALASGDVDYGTSTFGGVTANASGLPQIVVMVMTARPQHTIMSREPLPSVEALRAKSIVVDVRGGILDVMVRLALQQAGLQPDTDVSLLYAGTPDARLAMLLSNRVDAGAMDLASTVKAEQQGYQQVVDLGKVVTLPLAGLVATPERIQTRPDEIRTLIRATLEGTVYLRDNRDASIAIIADWAQVDRATAAQLYDLARESFTLDGRITEAAMRATIEMQAGYQATTPVDLDRFVDFSLLPGS